MRIKKPGRSQASLTARKGTAIVLEKGMGVTALTWREELERGIRLKIIGDSLAAGAGSSGCRETEEVLFTHGGRTYFRMEAPNSWWGRLEGYLAKTFPRTQVENRGCCGACTEELAEHLEELVSPEDGGVLLLAGLNDRKRPDGMTQCRKNCRWMVERLGGQGKRVLLLTPTPSTRANEGRPDRLYHTPQVVRLLRETAAETGVPLADCYAYVEERLRAEGLTPEDVMPGEDGGGDGLHPPDRVQELMFRCVLETMGLETAEASKKWLHHFFE